MPSDPLSLVVNPFAALGAIAGPAVLTNACSILALGTSNRLARVLDLARATARNMAASSTDDPRQSAREHQLTQLDDRAHVLLRALRAFYSAIGLFAAAALLSAIGSVLVTYGRRPSFEVAAVAALACATTAVLSLVYGCIGMTRETFLAVRTIDEEVKLMALAVAEGQRTKP